MTEFTCRQCGAKIEYKPGTKSLECPYCGHLNPIPTSEEEVRELDFGEFLGKAERERETVESRTVTCGGCGAVVDLPPNVETDECPFCGSLIKSAAAQRKGIKPNALLPFKVDRRQAEAAFRQWLRARYDNDIDKLNAARLAEGENLYHDFKKRIGLLDEYVAEISSFSGKNTNSYRETLQQKMQQLLSEYPVDEQRIAFEAALIAEKMDITEEITRLKSHLKSYREALAKEESIGKRLGFILQELNREANTIASKAADEKISSLVIEIKNELEKLREQAMNIE